MAELGVGVIGLGVMGRIHATNLLGGIPGARLAAVADSNAAALADWERHVAGLDTFSDMEALLASPKVDAVVVASSSTSHYGVLTAVLERGLPVLCEKPLAPSLEDSVTVHRAFLKAQVPLQIGFMRRFDPAYVRAFDAIQAGEIGEVYHYSGVSRDQTAPPVEAARVSGGFFADTGVHEFDLVRWLLGREIREVFARGGVFVSEAYRQIGDVDQAHLSLAMEGGALGLVELTRNGVYGYDIRTEVLGRRGAIRIGVQAATGATVLTSSGIRGDHVMSYRDRFRDAYRAELEAFVAAVREKTPVLVSSLDGIRAVAAAEAAGRSLASGRPEEVRRVG